MRFGRRDAAGVVRTRTGAVVRYLAGELVGSQRYLVPLLAFAAVLAILSAGDPGPPPGPWPASALALYPTATWFALVDANVEDPVQRTVTTAAAGGVGRVAAGTLLLALATDAVLVAAAVGVPALRAGEPYPPHAVALGVLAHVAAATTGTAVGLLCARPLVARIGWSFCLAATVVVPTMVTPWLPPVGSAVRALGTGGPAPVAQALLGMVLAGAATVVSWAVARHRS